MSNILEIIIFASLLFSIIYGFGIVWRVEKKLDLAFKLFLVSIIAFAISEIASLFIFDGRAWAINTTIISKTVFTVLFLLGMVETRSMIRKLDGEQQ